MGELQQPPSLPITEPAVDEFDTPPLGISPVENNILSTFEHIGVASESKKRTGTGNQDGYALGLEIPIVVIADGMGSGKDSGIIAEKFSQGVCDLLSNPRVMSVDYIQQRLVGEHGTLSRLLTQIFNAQKIHHRDGNTTLTAAKFLKHTGLFIHTGDSRAYAIEDDHNGHISVKQISQDQKLGYFWFKDEPLIAQHIHTTFEEVTDPETFSQYADAEKKLATLIKKYGLSDEDITTDLNRLLTKNGIDPTQQTSLLWKFWDLQNFSMMASNREFLVHAYEYPTGLLGFIFTTDGVHGPLTKTQVNNLCQQYATQSNFAQPLANALVKEAAAATGLRAKDDDRTAVVWQKRDF